MVGNILINSFGMKRTMNSLSQESQEKKLKRFEDIINVSNMLEFFVGFDEYEVIADFERQIPKADTWWKECKATFLPKDIKECAKMQVDETLLWRALNSGRNVIISGRAGSGKSNLLTRFVQHAADGPFSYALTGPTGIAAYNINGETLHRALSLGLAQEDPVTLFRNIVSNKKKYAKTWKFLTNTKLLIIDEISMVHADLFAKLDYLFRKASECCEPFGNCRLLVVGDFTQLGPVVDYRSSSNSETSPRLVLDSDVWQQMKWCRLFLDRNYRQVNGPFLDLLNEVRVGQISETSMQLLLSRLHADLNIATALQTEQGTKTYALHPLDIYPRRKDVEHCNQENLEELVAHGAKLHSFFPVLNVRKKDGVIQIDEKEYKQGQYLISKEGRKQIEDYFPVFYVKLAEGAQIMMRCNIFIDMGICNGTMGIVTSIDNNNCVKVLFAVKGKFLDKPIEVTRTEFTYSLGKTGEVVMQQFPLSLAWSCTIHRCQGLTLDGVRISASSMFEAGQLYTAISRVRDISHLSLLDFHSRSLLTDSRAVEFETRSRPSKKAITADSVDSQTIA